MKKKLSKRERNKRSFRRQMSKIFGSEKEQQKKFMLMGQLLEQDLEMKMCGHKPVTLCKLP